MKNVTMKKVISQNFILILKRELVGPFKHELMVGYFLFNKSISG